MESLGQGYRALVIGASGGIGGALAGALARDPRCGEVATLSRRRDGFDLIDEAGVAAAAERLGGEFHLILCATGALVIDGAGPEKALRQMTPETMMAQFAVNALGPALVLKHFAPRLTRRERAVMAVLSARVGSIGDNRLGGWISYRTAKAAVNQILRTAAVEVARSHPQAVLAALHPGTVATALSEPFAAGRDRRTPEESAAAMLSVLDALPAEATGGFLAHDGQPIPW